MSVAAAANALTSVADVKYAWGRKQADTDNDDRIQTLINLLSGRIAEWCGRVFISTAYSLEVYDGEGQYDLILKQYPVTTLTLAKIDDVQIITGTLEDLTTWALYGSEGILWYAPGWTVGRRNVKVTYTAGYAAADIPRGLAMACVEWCIVLLEGRYKDAKVKMEDSFPPPEHIAAALAPYKRRDF